MVKLLFIFHFLIPRMIFNPENETATNWGLKDVNMCVAVLGIIMNTNLCKGSITLHVQIIIRAARLFL